MSMNSSPCSGYVIEVDKLILTLSPEVQPEAKAICKAILDGDKYPEDLFAFFSKHLTPNLSPDDVFFLRDEDDVNDDMERGVLYAVFDEATLYKKVETSSMKALRGITGVPPTLRNWSIYG